MIQTASGYEAQCGIDETQSSTQTFHGRLQFEVDVDHKISTQTANSQYGQGLGKWSYVLFNRILKQKALVDALGRSSCNVVQEWTFQKTWTLEPTNLL